MKSRLHVVLFLMMVCSVALAVAPTFSPRVRNQPVTCAASMLWSPDGGTYPNGSIQADMAVGKPAGVVDAGRFFLMEYRAHTAAVCTATNPCFFCHRSGTTRGNFQTACAKKCNTCTEGEEYVSPRAANLDDFCIYLNAASDAGVVINVEMAE